MFRSALRLCRRPTVPVVQSATATITRQFSFAFPSPRKLAEITDLSKLSEESPENVKAIWNIYHEDQVHANGTTLSPDHHKKIIERAKTW
jgi:hypothetical protein